MGESVFQRRVIREKYRSAEIVLRSKDCMCVSLEKDEDLVLVLEKETEFKIGKLGSGNLRHLR